MWISFYVISSHKIKKKRKTHKYNVNSNVCINIYSMCWSVCVDVCILQKRCATLDDESIWFVFCSVEYLSAASRYVFSILPVAISHALCYMAFLCERARWKWTQNCGGFGSAEAIAYIIQRHAGSFSYLRVREPQFGPTINEKTGFNIERDGKHSFVMPPSRQAVAAILAHIRRQNNQIDGFCWIFAPSLI